jgi:hypothetical protein
MLQMANQEITEQMQPTIQQLRTEFQGFYSDSCDLCAKGAQFFGLRKIDLELSVKSDEVAEAYAVIMANANRGSDFYELYRNASHAVTSLLKGRV